MKEMRKMMKMMLAGLMMLAGTTTINAEETQVTSEVDTTYIKLDENREPINHVNLSYDELVEKVGQQRQDHLQQNPECPCTEQFYQGYSQYWR